MPDEQPRVTPERGITRTRYYPAERVEARGPLAGFDVCLMPTCKQMIGYHSAVIVGTTMTLYGTCTDHRADVVLWHHAQAGYPTDATLWRRNNDKWIRIPTPKAPPVHTVRFTDLPDTAAAGPVVPLDPRITAAGLALTLAQLVETFAAHWPRDGVPPRKGASGINWTECPECGHLYSTAAPVCPTLAVVWPLLKQRRHEDLDVAAHLDHLVTLAMPKPTATAACTEQVGALFDVEAEGWSA